MAQTYHYDKNSQKWVSGPESGAPSQRVAFVLPAAVSGAVVVVTCGASIFLWATLGPAKKGVPPVIEPKMVTHSAPVLAGLDRPVIGGLRFGAYAGEAAQVAGLATSSTDVLADPALYKLYRESVRRAYGLDLEDMNYFGIGQPDWGDRIDLFGKWLMQAGQYGDVTVALEPMGDTKFGVFEESPEMDHLRQVFDQAKAAGIKVWVRFASEANLENSDYSAYGRDPALRFHRSAVWFKSFMPDNIRMVFSPLINTAVVHESVQHDTIRWMFKGDSSTEDEPSPWDCIGGTLYRTKLPLEPTYDQYYDRLASLDRRLPFQLCEIGAPYGRRKELIRFLQDALNHRWPRLKKINLFARDINKRADPDGQFGFMNPDERARAIRESAETHRPMYVESYLRAFFLSLAKRT